MAVFWVVAPCSLVEVYQRFRGPCCLHHQGESQPRRQPSSYSPPWEPQILLSKSLAQSNTFQAFIMTPAYELQTARLKSLRRSQRFRYTPCGMRCVRGSDWICGIFVNVGSSWQKAESWQRGTRKTINFTELLDKACKIQTCFIDYFNATDELAADSVLTAFKKLQ
jgi:hypothetical protein